MFSIVGFPADVREAILGERGVLKGLRAGGIVVDMTTSEPSLAVEIAAAATAQGKAALDAPVSGGDIGAREARLSIMVGGSREVAAAVDPLFKLMVGGSCAGARLVSRLWWITAVALQGTNIRYMGGPGAGQHTKMVNQVLIASNMIGVVEGLLYARKCVRLPLASLAPPLLSLPPFFCPSAHLGGPLPVLHTSRPLSCPRAPAGPAWTSPRPSTPCRRARPAAGPSRTSDPASSQGTSSPGAPVQIPRAAAAAAPRDAHTPPPRGVQLLRRALHQGPRHRAGRVAAHGPRAARPGTRAPTLRGRAGAGEELLVPIRPAAAAQCATLVSFLVVHFPGLRAQGHAGALAGARDFKRAGAQRRQSGLCLVCKVVYFTVSLTSHT